MPLVASKDLGNRNGYVHSHRFPAANTALPTVNRHEAQLRTIVQFLQNNVVALDIFAMSVDEASHWVGPQPLAQEGAPRLSTTFVVGEEQGSPRSMRRVPPSSGEAPS